MTVYLCERRLTKFAHGLRGWSLGLSVEKCCNFHIGYSDFVLVYKLHGQSISPCKYLCDLDITVNSSLTPGQHFTAIVSEASARSNYT